MKVAYLCADPGIPVFGHKGASIHIQEVLRALLAQGMTITLFAQRLGGPVPAEFQEINIEPLPPLSANTHREERARQALEANSWVTEQLALTGPYDVIYERYSLWSHAGMTFARKAGITGILEVNAPLIEEQRKYRQLPLEQEAEQTLRQVLTNADTIIAVSPGVKTWLENFPESGNKIHVVANGVDPARYPARKAVRNNPAVIGFVGSLKPWHGVQTLVEAFHLLHQRGRPVRLSIVGDGPEYLQLRTQLTQYGLLSFCHFTGAVDHLNVPTLLAAMDIAVAPYPQLAGFYFSPLKIYEYMAARLPVITTRVGHLPEVVSEGKTGLLVPPDDALALCIAIEHLLDDVPLCQQLGDAGRQQVEQNQSWQSITALIWRLAGLK
ncbi:glycosyltransferase family 4 protein [Serratia silvae]|uniref:Glycosyltransferase family 4 protein n=1 Tax=Serratia silvae TaxID=2824122 RepID=A0ABT0KAJ8_9GAMM|nr:glycosyltransferase family 4 protein [Serratia silvae]MCL1028966.1 glycosyltransferase family 4 protein [Serratia silvae]